MKKISQEWLRSAEDDLEAIDEIIENESLTNIVAFHAQQAIEKSLKALIEEYDLKFKKTHKLMMLFNIVESIIDLQINEDTIIKLDSLYIESRYPSSLGLLPDGKPDQNEAKNFKNASKEVFRTIKSKLKED